ncbi:hypothetical protein [Pseudomonas chlororaphis]|uniref:Uncharacterized protein n=1 Tax=Pseudomonas chlororaphis TaxID=587753 RepID=A0A1Q8EXA6_9PSED|nr:hypothetical protein [Pseudomonas chlororaphis]OLF56436.1 hypothetical protein BTN82_00605 [Pseudomonas chlororaphis]
MIFKSAGENISPCSVGYRSLGFGEDTGLETSPYELTISFSELPEAFIKSSDSFIEQCKTDDIQQGFADIDELEKLNYPPFKNLIKSNPKLVAALIKDYLYFDLLDSLFPENKNLKLVINNIERIYTTESGIIVSGETFPFKTI